MNRVQRLKILVAIQRIFVEIIIALYMFCYLYRRRQRRNRQLTSINTRRYNLVERIPDQVKHLRDIVDLSDVKCVDNLRMTRNAFGRLCQLLELSGGLRSTTHVSITEQVAIFLCVIGHHKKNCVVRHDFIRSGRTISKHFHSVLKAVLRLSPLLLARPTPIVEGCQDARWRWFKGCLGALDGTHVEVHVSDTDKGRYRNRKGQISVNILGVCNTEGKFIYVLSGWEGSAADSRVLRDAINRPSGLKIQKGNYYLCDNGYSNGEGFLTPYRGVRYHLKEWDRGDAGPHNREELFNLKHSSARNVIERTFGLLKTRWGILRSPSYYPIKVHNRIIIACCLLHNFVRMEMPDDPLELEIPDQLDSTCQTGNDYVSTIETNPVWTSWRDELATEMYTEWSRRR